MNRSMNIPVSNAVRLRGGHHLWRRRIRRPGDLSLECPGLAWLRFNSAVQASSLPGLTILTHVLCDERLQVLMDHGTMPWQSDELIRT